MENENKTEVRGITSKDDAKFVKLGLVGVNRLSARDDDCNELIKSKNLNNPTK
jgi:hypothetical protein